MDKRVRFSLAYYLWVVGMILLFQWAFFSGPAVPTIPYSEFLARVRAGKVERVVLSEERIYGVMKGPEGAAGEEGSKARPRPSEPEPIEPPAKKTPWAISWSSIRSWFAAERSAARKAAEEREEKLKRQFVVTPLKDPDLLETLDRNGVEFEGRVETHFLRNLLLNWIVPFGLLFALWGFLLRRMGGGPSALSIGRSKAKIYEVDTAASVKFSDLAGIDEAIEEVKEVVSFLKEPERFQRLGARLPTGVLLVGPPGTGKTLLAKAVAGEAGVPFFHLSGSDFVEMFVGVGAARVRDLFQEAKSKAPCIVFIDELDAIGKSRAQAGPIVGGYDERENTLNQLLVEMDGFDARSRVVIMAATNRPEVLDRALLRPGRFDRQIVVDRPDREGRLAIFRIHTRDLKLGDDVDLERMAAQTPGFVGADIANICNEAALLASRRGRERIAMEDFQDAFERVIGGLERKGRVLIPEERRVVAYHESGHALVAHQTPGADPVTKISIVPRGKGALGYTLQAPLEDRFLLSYDELLGRIRTLLGGRAAEDVVFGQISTGAADDLEKASQIARSMLAVYGMSRRLPNLSLADSQAGGRFLGQGPGLTPHSAEIERLIGEEQLEILNRCYAEAKDLLRQKRDTLERLASRLLEREKLDEEDIEELLGPRSAAVGPASEPGGEGAGGRGAAALSPSAAAADAPGSTSS